MTPVSIGPPSIRPHSAGRSHTVIDTETDMRRTSPLHAAAAALGLIAGFALTTSRAPALDGSIAPYEVSVAWRSAPVLPEVTVQGVSWEKTPAPRVDEASAPLKAPPAAVRAKAKKVEAGPAHAKDAGTREVLLAKRAPRVRVVDLASVAVAEDAATCVRDASPGRES
jgi:hypothetical protein